MYAIFRALFDAVWGALRGEISASKSARDAVEDKNTLRRAGTKIRDYIRLRGKSGGV